MIQEYRDFSLRSQLSELVLVVPIGVVDALRGDFVQVVKVEGSALKSRAIYWRAVMCNAIYNGERS